MRNGKREGRVERTGRDRLKKNERVRYSRRRKRNRWERRLKRKRKINERDAVPDEAEQEEDKQHMIKENIG